MYRKSDLSYETLMKKVDSPYTLVIAAAKRARQLNEGKKALIDDKGKKPVIVAIEEIIAGEISFKRKRVKSIK